MYILNGELRGVVCFPRLRMKINIDIEKILSHSLDEYKHISVPVIGLTEQATFSPWL